MNPFLQQILGVLVRTAIVWLAATFGAELSHDQVTQVAAQATPIVAVLVWSIWQKYRGRQKLLTALAMPSAMTEHEVEAAVSAGDAPRVGTPKSEVPREKP